MSSASDTNGPDLSTALLALREGDLDGAEAIARRLFADGPEEPAVYQLAAVIALQRGEFCRLCAWRPRALRDVPTMYPLLSSPAAQPVRQTISLPRWPSFAVR